MKAALELPEFIRNNPVFSREDKQDQVSDSLLEYNSIKKESHGMVTQNQFFRKVCFVIAFCCIGFSFLNSLHAEERTLHNIMVLSHWKFSNSIEGHPIFSLLILIRMESMI